MSQKESQTSTDKSGEMLFKEIHHISLFSKEPLEFKKSRRRSIKPLYIDRLSPGEGTVYMNVPSCIVEPLCFKRMN